MRNAFISESVNGSKAAFTPNRALICAIAVCMTFVLTNCGGGGGGARTQPLACPLGQVGTPPNCTVPPPPACPPGQVGTPPNCTAPPPQPPPQPTQGCIPLHDGTCSSIGDFDIEAQRLAGEYRLEGPFRNQWGLGAISADTAYAHVNLLKGENVEPGAGVTIGFIDSGIDQDHPMFSGKTVTEVFLSGAADETGAARYSHGTAVASVAAGVHVPSDSTSPQGVAPGADIAMFAITLGRAGDTYAPISLTALANQNAAFASEINQALAWRNGHKRVDILNLSIGYQGLIDFYSEAELRANFGQAIAAMAQAGASEKAILVWAAGNAHVYPCDPSIMTSNCVEVEHPPQDASSGGSVDPPSQGSQGAVDAVSVELLAGLAARIAELRGHTIAVVALGPGDERVADFSNRCGIAADYCLAAPGQRVRAAYSGPDDHTGTVQGIVPNLSGTSFAAPFVSGGLAIMKQLFRDQLSNTELVTRLLETADDTGIYSDRAVYGRGKLDLAAATHPVGVLDVPLGTNTNRAGNSLHTTSLRLGAPLGDGLARSVANREIMAIDDLGAPFWYRLGDFVATAKGPPVDTRVRGFLADAAGGSSRRPGVRVQGISTENGGGHLSLMEGGMMTTLVGRAGFSASVFGTNQEHDAVGVALGWRSEVAPIGLRVGWMAEDETILGGEGHGAFGSLAVDTAFVRVEGDVRLGAWRFGASAEWGRARPRARGGIIDEVSPMTTSAFALHARAAVTDKDTVRFSLAQPLRVEDGRAMLTLPVARTKYGRVLHASLASPLSPDERQIDLAATWERPLADGRLRLGVVWSRNPGHSSAAGPRLTFLAGWRRAF